VDTSCCSCRGAQLSALLVFGFGSVRGVLANQAAPPRDQCKSADTAGTIASARAPRQPGPLARRRAPRAGWKCADQRLCDAAWHALRARLVERHGVTRYRFSRTEAAERRARCPQGEPSAMLPAVSAALAEWSPEGHRGASKRSIQTPRSGQCKRQRGRRGTRGAWSGPSAPDGRSDGKPRAKSSRRPRASGTTRRAAAM